MCLLNLFIVDRILEIVPNVVPTIGISGAECDEENLSAILAARFDTDTHVHPTIIRGLPIL